jgi:hypothetical protein
VNPVSLFAAPVGTRYIKIYPQTWATHMSMRADVVAATCTGCAAGQYQDQTGQSVCKTCPSSKYAVAGSASCADIVCPAGSVAIADPTVAGTPTEHAWVATFAGSHTEHHATQAAYCTSLGSRLPTYQEICPNGVAGNPRPFTGTYSWVPYSGFNGDFTNDAANWVFLDPSGNSYCEDHNPLRGPNNDPNWTGDQYGTQVFCVPMCEECPSGKYVSSTGAAACSSCPAGKYASAWPVVVDGQWTVGTAGQVCSSVCSDIGQTCNSARPAALTTNTLVGAAFLEAGHTCGSYSATQATYAGAPFSSTIHGNECVAFGDSGTSSCTENLFAHHLALCYCENSEQPAAPDSCSDCPAGRYSEPSSTNCARSACPGSGRVFDASVADVGDGYDVATIFGNLGGEPCGGDGARWTSPVQAPNGYIYAFPLDEDNVLKLDPDTDTMVEIGSLGTNSAPNSDYSAELIASNKFYGAVLASNGCIYAIPYHGATVVAKLDPATDTITTFGAFTGAHKYRGGVIASNPRYIYGIPNTATGVLKIDTLTDTATTFGSLGSLAQKWDGGALADTGLIYACPSKSTAVLRIDPSDDTTSLFGSFGSESTYNKYSGAVRAPNGAIYCIPENAEAVLKINPTTDTTSTFGSLGAGRKWEGGVLGPNGAIYAFPLQDSSAVLKINPSDDTTSQFSSFGAGNNYAWCGGVLATNGYIYATPWCMNAILKIGAAGACAACSAGKVFAHNATTSFSVACTACPDGKYAASSGATACSTCAAGKYADASAAQSTSCSDCSAGTFSIVGASDCSDCPGGKYGVPEFAKMPVCTGGYEQIVSEAECVTAAAVLAPNNANLERSMAMPVLLTLEAHQLQYHSGCVFREKSGDNKLVLFMLPSLTSQVNEVITADYWDLCVATTAVAAEQCLVCPGGKYAGVSSAEPCLVCLGGKYSVVTTESSGAISAALSCTSCPAGKYAVQNAEGATACASCATGQFAIAESVGCNDCAVGKYHPSSGSTCHDCSTGQYNAGLGLNNCYHCPSGKYQDAAAYHLCHDCAVTTWTAGLQSQTECVSIPTQAPTAIPTHAPSAAPTPSPTPVPSSSPTAAPTASPTIVPTHAPSAAPSPSPTPVPSSSPTATPTAVPTVSPTHAPTPTPTRAPTPAAASSSHCPWLVCVSGSQGPCVLALPLGQDFLCVHYETGSLEAVQTCPQGYSDCTLAVPTSAPTASPTAVPTHAPSAVPSPSPTPVPSSSPTATPTASPSAQPTVEPTASPTPLPTVTPTAMPTGTPTTANCDNGERDGDETDVDCGGVLCLPCSEGDTCAVDADCLGVVCRADKTCTRATPAPTQTPTPAPSNTPTPAPTALPTAAPSPSPTFSPSPAPTPSPTPICPPGQYFIGPDCALCPRGKYKDVYGSLELCTSCLGGATSLPGATSGAFGTADGCGFPPSLTAQPDQHQNVTAGEQLVIEQAVHASTSTCNLTYQWKVDGPDAMAMPGATGSIDYMFNQDEPLPLDVPHAMYELQSGRWKLLVKNCFGSAQSNGTDVTILPGPPTWWDAIGGETIPHKLSQSDGMLTIKWNPAEANGAKVTAYELLRQQGNGAWMPVSNYVPGGLVRVYVQLAIVSGLDGDDVFSFKARGYNKYGWSNDSAILSGVFANPAPPAFKVQPVVSAEVYPGGVLNLGATVTGTPGPTFQWVRDGVGLVDSGRVVGAQSNVLAVSNISESDDGFYQLHASNELGTVASVSLVFSSLKAPKTTACIKRPLAAAPAGGFLLLRCSSTGGNPDPEFVWEFTPVNAAAVQSTWISAGTHEVNNTETQHAGLYTCIARNKIGQTAADPQGFSIAPCIPGTYSDAAGHCHDCTPGKFKPLEGGHQCSDCPAGKVSVSSGMVQCTSCHAGSFSSDQPAVECFVCPAGKYGAAPGAASCVSCEVGSFASQPGQWGCEQCGVHVAGSSTHSSVATNGTFLFLSSRGSADDCRCAENFFSCPFETCPKPPLVTASRGMCQPCTKGMWCKAPGQVLSTLRVLPSYFKFRNDTIEVVACEDGVKDCGGGNRTLQCAPGSTGLLCHACATGFKRKKGKCVPCPLPRVSTSVYLTLLAAALLVGSFHFAKKRIRRGGQQLNRQVHRLKGERADQLAAVAAASVVAQAMSASDPDSSAIGTGSDAPTSSVAEDVEDAEAAAALLDGAGLRGEISALAKVLISWLQCLTSITLTFEVKWPAAFADSLSSVRAIFMLDFVSMFSGFGCDLDGSFRSTFYFHMMVPLIGILVLFVSYLPLYLSDNSLVNRPRLWLQSVFSKWQQHGGSSMAAADANGMQRRLGSHLPAARQESFWKKASIRHEEIQYCRPVVIHALAFLAFLLYPGLCTKIFQCWQCRTLDGKPRLVSQLSLTCWEGEHATLARDAVIYGLVYIVGIPAAIFFALAKNREEVKDQCRSDGEPHSAEAAVIHAEYGAFYAAYVVWYFELVEIARKLVLTGGLISFSHMPIIQTSLGLLTAFTYIAVFCSVAPMRSTKANMLQLVASVQLFLTLQSGLMLAAGKCEDPSVMKYMDPMLVFISVFTTVIGIALLLLTAKERAGDWWGAVRLLCRRLRCKGRKRTKDCQKDKDTSVKVDKDVHEASSNPASLSAPYAFRSSDRHFRSSDRKLSTEADVRMKKNPLSSAGETGPSAGEHAIDLPAKGRGAAVLTGSVRGAIAGAAAESLAAADAATEVANAERLLSVEDSGNTITLRISVPEVSGIRELQLTVSQRRVRVCRREDKDTALAVYMFSRPVVGNKAAFDFQQDEQVLVVTVPAPPAPPPAKLKWQRAAGLAVAGARDGAAAAGGGGSVGLAVEALKKGGSSNMGVHI